MNKTKFLMFVPVLVLLGWTLSVQAMISGGTKLELPVRGYDPRDILAGHYLSVEVDYGAFPSDCKKDEKTTNRERLKGGEIWRKQDAFFCADAGRVSLGTPENCPVFIKGYCQYGRFHDGVSRFYVPEKMSPALERAVRNKDNNPMLRLSVTPDGRAFPIDLILRGKPFKEQSVRALSARE